MTEQLTEPQPLEHRPPALVTEWRASGLPVNATPNVLVASFLAVGSSRHLLGFTAYNSSGDTTYVQLFDAVDLPADTAVPVMVWELPTLSTLAVSYWPYGRRVQRGLYIVNSSTDTTKTLGTADLLLDVQYV